jgi:AcrR family transcriptional regulator
MQTQMRKDAVRSRRAILAAARELYRDDAEASFAEIAVAAGVGQATVYRHFTDRRALLVELAEEDMDRLEERIVAEPIGPGSMESLLREMIAEQLRSQGLIGAMRAGEVEESKVRELSDRARDLFTPRLAAAQETGLVRADLGSDDVMLVLSMIDGALASQPDRRGREQAAESAFRIVMDGLRSRP